MDDSERSLGTMVVKRYVLGGRRWHRWIG